MKEKLFYRVANIETNQGLWYDWDGKYTGLIHSEFNFCANSKLPMPFDPALQGWLSATESLDDLWGWFPKEDIHRLQPKGWFLYGYMASKFKAHENHHVIDQKTSYPLFRVIISKAYEMKTIERVQNLDIQHGRRSAVLSNQRRSERSSII